MFDSSFYFLRHGETTANLAAVISGQLDVELTELGREQARAAARVLATEAITGIYSSPLRRARDTAEPIARALDLPVAVVPEFAERARGALEGRPRDAPPANVPGEESFDAFRQRVLRGFSMVSGRAPLVVAHLGVFRVLCHTLEIAHVEGPLANALPLRFTPLGTGRWKLEALVRECQ